MESTQVWLGFLHRTTSRQSYPKRSLYDQQSISNNLFQILITYVAKFCFRNLKVSI